MQIYPVTNNNLETYQQLFFQEILNRLSTHKGLTKHYFTNSVNDADIYLFFNSFFTASEIRKHPLVKKNPAKCFYFCNADISYPVLPGLYAALPSNILFDYFYRTGFYLNATNSHINKLKNTLPVTYLASFQGGLSSRLRQKLVAIDFKTDKIKINIVEPQWQHFYVGTGFAESQVDFLTNYAKLIYASKFILCPRGNGISSYRLFETLEAGRVPVILSLIHI
jgi:hypothetical protein